MLPKFGINFFTLPTFISHLSAIFYNNLTACHKKQQVFLELMDNHFVIHVIHQDIQDQLRECSLFDFFLPIKVISNPSTNYQYQGTL